MQTNKCVLKKGTAAPALAHCIIAPAVRKRRDHDLTVTELGQLNT